MAWVRVVRDAGIAIIILFGGGFVSADEDYERIFADHYTNALTYLRQHQNAYCNGLAAYGGQTEILVPVIFPELVRYSLIRDRIEITALKIFYTHLGMEHRQFADFSVGRFQMKPTFVEMLEDAVTTFGLSNTFLEVASYPLEADEKQIRRMRLQRLEDESWQITYLACFGAVIGERFGHMEWRSTEQQIAFYASAYNHDFLAEETDIRAWMSAKVFPHGTEYEGGQFAYGDVSLHFYRTYWERAVREMASRQQ